MQDYSFAVLVGALALAFAFPFVRTGYGAVVQRRTSTVPGSFLVAVSVKSAFAIAGALALWTFVRDHHYDDGADNVDAEWGATNGAALIIAYLMIVGLWVMLQFNNEDPNVTYVHAVALIVALVNGILLLVCIGAVCMAKHPGRTVAGKAAADDGTSEWALLFLLLSVPIAVYRIVLSGLETKDLFGGYASVGDAPLSNPSVGRRQLQLQSQPPPTAASYGMTWRRTR